VLSGLLGLLDQLVRPVPEELLGPLDRVDHQVLPVVVDQLDLPVQVVFSVLLVQVVRPDCKGLLVPPVQPVQLAHLEELVHLVHLVLRVRRLVVLDRLVLLDQQDQLVLLDQVDQMCMVLRVQLDHLDHLDSLVHLVQLVHLVHRGQWELPVYKEHLARRADSHISYPLHQQLV